VMIVFLKFMAMVLNNGYKDAVGKYSMGQNYDQLPGIRDKG
jgi:hypothetical protein